MVGRRLSGSVQVEFQGHLTPVKRTSQFAQGQRRGSTGSFAAGTLQGINHSEKPGACCDTEAATFRGQMAWTNGRLGFALLVKSPNKMLLEKNQIVQG